MTINITLNVRSEDGDAAIDLGLLGKQPFAAIVLTLDNALDLNLRLLGCAAELKRFGREEL